MPIFLTWCDTIRSDMVPSFRNTFHECVILISTIVCLFFSTTNLLGSTVTVQTKNGRELTGLVDAKTNTKYLWVRREEKRIQLTTAVAWSSILTAQVDGNTIGVTALAELAPQIITNEPDVFLAEYLVDPVQADGWPEIMPTANFQPMVREPRIAGPIVSLEIEAFLLNLDRDVEPDGLELLVTAIDTRGYRVPVRGNLQARLWGDRDVWQIGRVQFDELQRWSQPVHLTDFEQGVARYVLRFRSVRPEFDWELLSYALLNVRLGVYGQGNYEASEPVQIRQFNPFRDRMQLHQGSRFFREELTQPFRRRNFAPPGTGRQARSY
jgi:hypothetical protein